MSSRVHLRSLGLTLLLSVAVALPARAQQTIAEARQQGTGATVTVEGTVTRAFGAYARIQDTSGPTGASALVIRQTSGANSGAFKDDISDGTIQPGTVLHVTGETSEFNGLFQINNSDLQSYEVVSQGAAPDPQNVTLADLNANGEDYESELVTITGLSVVGASGTFANDRSYTVQDADGTTLTFRVQGDDETALGGTSIPEGAFDYTGVIGEFSGDYQLIPVRPSDLQPSRSFRFSRLYTLAQEDDSRVSVDVQAFNLQSGDAASVTARVGSASTATNGTDVTGFTSPQTLTFSGSNPAPKTLTFEIVADDESEGVERLEVVLETTDGTVAAPRQFTLWIQDDATAQGVIAAGQTGDALIDQLQQTYGDPPTLGYDVARDSMYATIYNDQGTVEGIYTGYQVTVDPTQGDPSTLAANQGINTEHLWPQSKGSGEEPARSNLHILAPAWEEANSARCNYPYAEIDDDETERWFGAGDVDTQAPPESERDAFSESVGNDCGNPSDDGRFEPREAVKGDVARAVFYFVTVYPNRANLQFYETQKQTLLNWHRQDPVDAAEMRRTILQASYQGNKLNPFVMDSTLIDRAYFSGGGSPGGDVLTIADARAQGGGSTATVEGTVTRTAPDGAYLQDDTGGLFIFQEEGAFYQDLGGTIREGTRLRVAGALSFYNGLLELTEVPDNRYDALSQGNALPSAPTLTLSEIAANGEAYESELVRVEDFRIDDGGDPTFQGGINYAIEDASGALTLRIPGGSELEGAPIPDRATFQGVLGQFNGAGFNADEPDDGYQLVALRADDLPETVTLPEVVTVDIEQSFDDPGDPQSYRLVALPGAVDRPLASTLSGSAGTEWQAFWDDGSDTDFFVKHDGSDTFTLRPGRGFWLVSTSAWTVSDEIETVDLDAENRTSISLHDGWNIISNPLDKDVAWSAVEAANDGPLQALWRFDGTFQQTDTLASAKNGTAFYFLNNQGLETLQIPYPGLASAPPDQKSTAPRTLRLVAHFGPALQSAVRVGTHPDAAAGRDAYDQVAPPARFEAARLRIACETCTDPRQRELARDLRPAISEGQTYDLVLQHPPDTAVTLQAHGLDAFPGRDLVLVEPGSGRAHDLRADSTIQPRPDQTTTRLRLLIGTPAYVEDERPAPPQAVVLLPNYPNPFRDRTTIEYALPNTRHVRLAVYDVLGRRVRVLVDERQPAGHHRVQWSGHDRAGQPLASGLYLLRLDAGSTQHTRRIVLVR